MDQLIYKITTQELWDVSQDQGVLALADSDREFIHFAEAHDIERIARKFFAHQPSLMVLEIDPHLLTGRLVKERNPGGEQEYYHLYDGSVPLAAITDISVYQNRLLPEPL